MLRSTNMFKANWWKTHQTARVAQLPTRRTYPETNIAPKNWWLEDDPHLLLGGQQAPRPNGWLNHPKPRTPVANLRVEWQRVPCLGLGGLGKTKGRGWVGNFCPSMVGDKGQTVGFRECIWCICIFETSNMRPIICLWNLKGDMNDIYAPSFGGAEWLVDFFVNISCHPPRQKGPFVVCEKKMPVSRRRPPSIFRSFLEGTKKRQDIGMNQVLVLHSSFFRSWFNIYIYVILYVFSQ